MWVGGRKEKEGFRIKQDFKNVSPIFMAENVALEATGIVQLL